MSLLCLPVEVLKEIFDHVGSSFFRDDLRRLTICKQWSEFALPAFFKCLKLSEGSLKSFVKSGGVEKPSLLKDGVETLELEFRANGNTYFMNTSPFRDLNVDLRQLAIVAQQFHRLRTLRLIARRALFVPDGYVSPSAIRAFLSMENLTVLILDLFGSVMYSRGHESRLHICPLIGARLGTLRTLHLRLDSICPQVLKLRDPHRRLSLGVMVINLSVKKDGVRNSDVLYSTQCGSRYAWHEDFPRLKRKLQKVAKTLVPRMRSPQLMRILTHSLPDLETESFDVLTGKTMKLDEDMAWDEDGEIIEEGWLARSEGGNEDSSTSSDDPDSSDE